jgi:hypothetical protein
MKNNSISEKSCANKPKFKNQAAEKIEAKNLAKYQRGQKAIASFLPLLCISIKT